MEKEPCHKRLDLINEAGPDMNGETDNPAVFTFSQKTRQTNYRVGSFSVPLNTIRTELNLRSTFFSVIAEGDSIILKGRGYGHGVGLCQEGAMTMAEEGHTCKQIIGFYYSDVIITDIKNAVILDRQSPVLIVTNTVMQALSIPWNSVHTLVFSRV